MQVSIKEHDIELIEKYVDNTLTDEEHALFDNKIKSEPSFAEEVKYQKTLLYALRVGHEKELKAEIRSLYDAVKKSPSGKKKSARLIPLRKVYAAAATIALLVTVSVVWYQLSEPKHEQLFTAYYSPYPAKALTRGADESAYNKALENYYNKRYETAAVALEELVKKDPENPGLYIVLGCAYLGADRPEAAATRFDTAATHTDDDILLQQIAWYKALSLLKANEKESATAALKEIASDPGVRQEDAENLLKELK